MSRPRSATDAPLDAGTSGSQNRMRSWWARSGLAARIGLSALVVGAGLALVFVVLFLAITGLRHRSLEARHSQQVIATANQLQTLVIDLETGVRGFALTHDQTYLDPWRQAANTYKPVTRRLLQLTNDTGVQHRRALGIRKAINEYFANSLLIVSFLGRNPSFGANIATATRGRRQVEDIRNRFSRFLAAEQALGDTRDDRARATARNALIVGGIALGGGLFLILLVALYVNRAVAGPVRSAAAAAERIAGGDFSGRLQTDGPGEVGRLERTFNSMAASL